MPTLTTNPTAMCVLSPYDSLLLVARMIGAAGFDLVTVYHNEDVFEQLGKIPKLDLIVLDRIETNEQLEYYAQIKTSPSTCHIPLIAVFVKEPESFDKKLLGKLGADRHIVKPIDPDKFQKLLRNYLAT
jgi:CheY-like chemotaxis protein